MAERSPEPSGRPTKEQEKEMKEMRSCQRMAGWYGLWSTVFAGAVSFGGLMLTSRERVPKTYIPMISLGCATLCGWCVSVWFTKSCRMNQLTKIHARSSIATVNTSAVDGSKASHEDQETNSIYRQSNKFGDKEFYKEEK